MSLPTSASCCERTIVSLFWVRVVMQTRIWLLRSFLDLSPCGAWVIAELKSVTNPPYLSYPQVLCKLVDLAYNNLKAAVLHTTPLCWRTLHSVASLLWTLLDCFVADNHTCAEWKALIARLDLAIIVSGVPGDGRLDMFLDAIGRIQNHAFPYDVDNASPDSLSCDVTPNMLPLGTAALSVQQLSCAPTLLAFQSKHCSEPFVIRKFASDWPAVIEKRWSSKSYLLRAGGRGRIVPVEVGSDYRTDDWTQTMMEWKGFLDYLSLKGSSNKHSNEIVYLAQHDLFKQFPQLKRDIFVPDYVYCSLPPPKSFPGYKPPANEDRYVMNTWLGPGGTSSPAHTVRLS